MIFRLDGEVGELLALTPILREWKRRHEGDKVLVETYTPEIFFGNPNVDMAVVRSPDDGEFFDMNFVRWRELGTAVAELYALAVFGDKQLATWRVEMTASEDDRLWARMLWPPTGKPRAVVGFDMEKIERESAQGVKDMLVEDGWEVLDVSAVSTWGVAYAAIEMAELFVGSDGDASAIALATQTPAVVCYSYRSPYYFPPFRGNVPFVPLVPDRSVCEHSGVCHARNSHTEYSKVYSQGCVMEQKFCCRSRDLRMNVALEVASIVDRA